MLAAVRSNAEAAGSGLRLPVIFQGACGEKACATFYSVQNRKRTRPRAFPANDLFPGHRDYIYLTIMCAFVSERDCNVSWFPRLPRPSFQRRMVAVVAPSPTPLLEPCTEEAILPEKATKQLLKSREL